MLREKKETAISTGSLVGGAFGASDASSRWSAAQHPPVARTRAPARLRLGGDFDVFFGLVDSSCEAQQARYGMRRAPVGPLGADAILWEALWMGRTDELTLLDSCDGIGELIGWGGF